MVESSCKEERDDGYQPNIQRCSRCSTLKNERFKYGRHQRFFSAPGISDRRWHFLLALSSWHSISVFLLVTLLSTWKGIGAQKPPPNYAHGNMPDTNFTCDHKTTGGYYADTEAGCQMFHVCVRISEEEIKDYKFLCPNNTVFDQKNFICTNWWEIDCQMSIKYYSKNDLFKPTETTTRAEVEYVDNQEPVYYEYVYEYTDPEPSPAADSKDFHGRHRLSFGKSTREEKVINTKENLNSFSKNTSPVVSSSVSISKPRTTFSTSSIKRTSVDFSKPSVTLSKSPKRTPSTTPITTSTTTTTTSTSTTTTPVPTTTSTTQSTTGFRFTTSNSATKRPFRVGVIGQSVVEPAFQTDSEDPFANYDWKKDSGNLTPRSRGGRKESNIRADDGSNRRRSPHNDQTRASRRRNASSRRTDDTNPKAKLREFSNFRFYKTAFGVSYSSDDYFSTTESPAVTPKSEPKRLTGRSTSANAEDVLIHPPNLTSDTSSNRGFRRFRKTDDQTAKGARLRFQLRRRATEQRRIGRTASRTTRYSKYAR